MAGNKLDLAPAPTALDCSLISPHPLVSVAGAAAARQEADQLLALDDGGRSLERWAKHCFACLLKAIRQAVVPGKAAAAAWAGGKRATPGVTLQRCSEAG